MGTISDKLTYLNGTKQAIKTAINEDFEVIDDNTTFREYADEISSNNAKYKALIPMQTENATNTLDISNSAGIEKALVTQYGNTEQEGTPTPETPIDIVNITGTSTITISNSNNTQSQSYTINLGDIELCKINNYKDRIYLLNGKWYLEKKIGKAILNGSESWTITNSGTQNWYYTTNIKDQLISPNIPVGNFKSNYYKNENISNNNTLQGFNLNSNGNTITNVRIRYGTEDSIGNYKRWLSNNNVIIYSPLSTSVITEITDLTLLNQLNSIKLFEGVNHLTFTNESGLDVEFDIAYYKDWKLV